jgi:hypothetical protein
MMVLLSGNEINDPVDTTSIKKTNDPVKITWDKLVAIRYEYKYEDELNKKVYQPIFTSDVKALDGKMIEIEGFVIPIEEGGESIVLSMNPYASCFFCGQASPASVMTIYLKGKKRDYVLDDYIYFQGRLELNYTDPNDFYYILHDAEEIVPESK